MKDKPEDTRASAPLARLDSMLKKEFTAEMGAPMTGRFTLIVPFFPFSASEQAVVAHKFILDFVDKMRRPIDLLSNRLIGHVHLALQNDGKIAAHLAEMGYEEALGARSLQRIVQQQVHVKLADSYVEGDDEITEGTNEGPLQKYTVRLNAVDEDVGEVVVTREGFTDVRKFDDEAVGMPGRFVVPGRYQQPY